MFKLVDPHTPLPPLYDEVERKLPTKDDKGWSKVGGWILRPKVDLMPQQGFQEEFAHCDANIIFLCGESQVGKSYGIHLKALQGIGLKDYTSIFISMQQNDMKKGSAIARDTIAVVGNYSGCQYSLSDPPTFVFPKYNNSYVLTHSNFETLTVASKWEEFQEHAKKRQASYIAIDEATAMLDYRMFMYWLSRNRDESGVLPQLVASFNPNHEHYTTTILKCGGYIGDDWFLRKDMLGKIRYFYNQGEDPTDWVWGDTPEQVAELADIKLSEKELSLGITIREAVKSFTVFTGETADNGILLNATKGQNIGNLHNVGAKQRAVLKSGYFGVIEHEELKVSRQMIHDMWENATDTDETMYATLDVSGGGKGADNCPLIIWKGLTIIDILLFSGDPKELEDWIKTQLRKYKVNIANFAFDANSIGNYLRAYVGGMPLTGQSKVRQEIDENGNIVKTDEYYNLRSQLYGKLVTLLSLGDISCILDKNKTIPYGKEDPKTGHRSYLKIIDILLKEINVFITVEKNRKIYFRHKDEYKNKYKSSPDLMDAISLRMVFELNLKEKKQPPVVYSEDNYQIGYNRGWRQGQTKIYL